MSFPTGRQTGSALVELLLGVLIFCVLTLLLVAAIQKLREMSIRVGCQNQLMRVGHALHVHHDLRGVFPGVGGYLNEASYLVIHRPDTESGEMRLGLGVPFATPEAQPGSWLYQIMPYFDAALASRFRDGQSAGQGLAVEGVLCSARGRPKLLGTPAVSPLFGEVRYSSVPRGMMHWGRTDYAANGRLIPARGEPLVRFSNVRPGLANAILVGEKSLDVRDYSTGGWVDDGPALVGGPTCTRTGTRIRSDSLDPELDLLSPALAGWGSAHPTGAHFLFAGGQVRLIRHGLSEELVTRLMGPSNAVPDLD